ncbi:hypothetical protein AX15_000927 [Amanita polypyramis BW_CC]|nr:hypothetical protein AX15_000927 [Amanita polypyramis BW_CC]
MEQPASIQTLVGLRLSSPALTEFITRLSSIVSTPNTTVPDIKSYSDAIYLSYFTLGLTLLFVPQIGYKPTAGSKLSDLNQEKLVLESIDVYNAPPTISSDERSSSVRSRRAELAFSKFVALPLDLSIQAEVKDKNGKVITRPTTITVEAGSTGKDFVGILHEPDRKGGGAGPSSGSIGIWCEWSKDGIMVEFGGEEARGPQAWERGKDAVWRVLTVFANETR